jgi:hypothetical protein
MEFLDEDALESSGWWGAIARLVEGGAASISDRVAISVLVAGEDYGFTQYEQHMKDLDVATFAVAENELLPAQGKTLQTITLVSAYLRSEAIKSEEDHEKSKSRDAA